MFASTLVKVPIAGLIPDEIAEIVIYRLKPNTTEPNYPVAKIIEGCSDFAGLLASEINTDDG
jgi:hypothetical protein